MMARRSLAGAPNDDEQARDVRKSGIWGFWKIGIANVAPDGEIIYPAQTDGSITRASSRSSSPRPARTSRPATSSDYVWGVTHARRLEHSRAMAEPHRPSKFAMAKNFDTLVLARPLHLRRRGRCARRRVETLRQWRTAPAPQHTEMVFSFGEYLEYLSRDLTLYSGDIISGGTGRGHGRRFEPGARRRPRSARPVSETRRHGRDALAQYRRAARQDHRQSRALSVVIATTFLITVMPGLVPGIHDLRAMKKVVDGRDEPGHNELGKRDHGRKRADRHPHASLSAALYRRTRRGHRQRRAGYPAEVMLGWTPEKSLAAMAKHDIAAMIVSVSPPGVWSADRAASRALSRACNEYGAGLVAKHRDRFGMFATLPLPDVEASLAEISYAFDTFEARRRRASSPPMTYKWPGDPAFAPRFRR